MRDSLRRPGVWELIVQLPTDASSARAKQLSRTVHGTKREAQRALAAAVAEVAAGKVSSAATTVGVSVGAGTWDVATGAVTPPRDLDVQSIGAFAAS